MYHFGENAAVANRQHRNEVFWVWSCILRVGNPHVGLHQSYAGMNVLVLNCIMMSGKVHFLTNTTPPVPNPKGWPPACLLPCYQFAHAVGRVALDGRLLTQLLSSRSEKYKFRHRRRWGKTPTIRILTVVLLYL